MSARPKTAVTSKTRSKQSKADAAPAQTQQSQISTLQQQLLQLQHENHAHIYKIQQNNTLIQEQNHTVTVLRDELKQADIRLKSIYSDLQHQHNIHNQDTAKKLQSVETEKQKLANELNTLHELHRVELEQKQNTIDTLQCEISEQKLRMNDMVQQFQHMLKQTLEKMNEKIVVSNQHIISDNNTTGTVVSFADYSIVGKEHTFEYKEPDNSQDYHLHT